MDGVLLGVCFLLVSSMGYLILSQHHLIRSLEATSDKLLKAMTGNEVDGGIIDEIKDTLADIVEDTLSTMAPPQASDHMAGALAQIAQMWAFKRFGVASPQEIIEKVLPPTEKQHE
tara:strand:+ start:2715 stop:3062 length:348 start_codon:yes stop_codon:yes gene_type:complete